MEPFISQIIIKNQMIEDEKNKPPPPKPSSDDEYDNSSPAVGVLIKEYRKLKMKIERISIEKNQQTNEALKHIYTVLIGNPDIEISIDLPEIIDHL